MAVEFIATGSPKSVSADIENLARARGNVTALVVPWESTATTLNMAVTGVKSDGWAIEHTNLGTITLTADGDDTRVAIAAAELQHEHKVKLTAIFEQFGRDIQRRLQGGDGVGDRPGDGVGDTRGDGPRR